MTKQNKAAFTLIELLVVVTIIVVLLALLAPAMDKAVYQAELAACGGRLKVIAAGALVYTGQSARAYPYRPSQQGGERKPTGVSHLGADDRPIMRDYIPLKALADPLCKPIDLSPEATQTDPFIYASYDLWFGFRYNNNRGLWRLGDRLQYGPTSTDLIAGDSLALADLSKYAIASHPDSNNVLMSQVFHRDSIFYVYSAWVGSLPLDMGGMDRNFAHTDGSVNRLTDLRIDTSVTPISKWDERLMQLPGRGTGAPDGEGLWLYVPR